MKTTDKLDQVFGTISKKIEETISVRFYMMQVLKLYLGMNS